MNLRVRRWERGTDGPLFSWDETPCRSHTVPYPASGARGRNEKLWSVRGTGLQKGNKSYMCELHMSEPTGVTFRLPLSSQIIGFSSDIII